MQPLPGQCNCFKFTIGENCLSGENYTSAIIGKRNGSIIVESVAQYIYPNNATQIAFLNKGLENTLETIFKNTTNYQNINNALHANTTLYKLDLQPTSIKNISDLKPYVKNCSLNYTGYTVEVVGESLQCVGTCATNTDYCNGHGACSNLKNGPSCSCFASDFVQYSGERCQLFERSAGFYAVLFGVLGAALLLLIILIIAVIVLRKKQNSGSWTSNQQSRKWFSLDEEYFNFSHTGRL
ncbi:mucin-3A [Lepisosteus oculatus]|uniref:mucin-3A n=1 Tax=Lepisosteus oculatus TaxID=7918 RepID=UPI00370FE9E4